MVIKNVILDIIDGDSENSLYETSKTIYFKGRYDVKDVEVNSIYMHGEHDCMTFTPHTYLPNSILLSFDVLSGHLYLSHLSTQS